VLAFGLPLVLGAVVARRWSRAQRLLAGALFGAIAIWSGVVAYVVARTGTASEPGAESFHVAVRWSLVLFGLFAVAIASAVLLRRYERASPRAGRRERTRRQAYMLALSLLAALPIALVFLAPGVGRFLTEEGERTFAAVFAWVIVFLVVLFAFEVVLDRPAGEALPIPYLLVLISLATLLAFVALFLAWQRGEDLANQVLAGNRITQSRFGMFSVRADIVCLDRVEGATQATRLPTAPVVYLGQSSGQLIAFDLERSETLRAREALAGIDIGAPDRVPLRIPASGLIVRVANLLKPANPSVVSVTVAGRTIPGKWACFRPPVSR
jgi:hypothetical protein